MLHVTAVHGPPAKITLNTRYPLKTNFPNVCTRRPVVRAFTQLHRFDYRFAHLHSSVFVIDCVPSKRNDFNEPEF